MKYNAEIHSRRSIRLKGYDYSKAGLYFITICCQDMKCIFGKIQNSEMILNNYGTIARNEWIKTSELRNNVELLEFIIMPNHMHGIIRIGELHSPSIGHSIISNGEFNSPQRPRGTSQTIGAIVRGYKSSVTKQLNLLNIGYRVWQRNYYEHIIQNEHAYQNISKYIINNPAKWQTDKFCHSIL